ncbi:hypothetical protein BN2475_90111 [Paraburkholderia ribeironis]|uniref:Uncharacterized protein n=1 Tax=Paraburkholderia ribeironis TaxID=1247936 RepID=A0A1N7RNB7_9BURK|nr:hypothetical protein [Paraburkholderia ribeironis]SIT36597.1 hypothetical protein BN2475_90111 [Paraburkholderia ribeironis]
MEQGGGTEQPTPLTQRGLLPVRVSHGAFFYVRYDGKTCDASQNENAFIAHTLDSVLTLLATANCDTPAVYLCSKRVDGDIAVRRITALSELPDTEMCILFFGDGNGVLWDESKHLGAVSTYADVNAPLSLNQLANIAARVASASDAERDPNDTGQDGG